MPGDVGVDDGRGLSLRRELSLTQRHTVCVGVCVRLCVPLSHTNTRTKKRSHFLTDEHAQDCPHMAI